MCHALFIPDYYYIITPQQTANDDSTLMYLFPATDLTLLHDTPWNILTVSNQVTISY